MSQVPRDQTSTAVGADRPGMVLSPFAVQIAPAETVQLTLSGAQAAPKWTTNRASVATVSRTGLVRGVAVGVAVITVKAGKAVANSTVTVSTGPAPDPRPPTAVLAVSGSEQNPITVTTAGTTAGTSAITSGSITWGDGQTTTFTGPPAQFYSHTYAVVGVGYTITLTVVTAVDEDSAPINVTIPVPPVATPGTVTFAASASHADVISYEARLHQISSTAIFASTNLGKPTPVAGVITVDLTSFFALQPLGVYTLSIAAISAGGTTDSGYSNEFSLPL